MIRIVTLFEHIMLLKQPSDQREHDSAKSRIQAQRFCSDISPTFQKQIGALLLESMYIEMHPSDFVSHLYIKPKREPITTETLRSQQRLFMNLLYKNFEKATITPVTPDVEVVLEEMVRSRHDRHPPYHGTIEHSIASLMQDPEALEQIGKRTISGALKFYSFKLREAPNVARYKAFVEYHRIAEAMNGK